MGSPFLIVDSLSSGYGKSNVVEDVSFSIEGGEVFGLVGLNGVGKTTLIKTILGLRDVRSGHVTHQGKEAIAYLPERFDPPWFLSGYDFISFSLSLYKKKISYEDAKIAAQSVSLDSSFLKKRVTTYSKGMRQKLGLLATVLTECPLLILDEPMSGLDPKARQEVKKIILSAKAAGRSVFMSSHILADIGELCDRVAVFHNKSIIFCGTPLALREKGEDKNLEKAFLNILSKEGMG